MISATMCAATSAATAEVRCTLEELALLVELVNSDSALSRRLKLQCAAAWNADHTANSRILKSVEAAVALYDRLLACTEFPPTPAPASQQDVEHPLTQEQGETRRGLKNALKLVVHRRRRSASLELAHGESEQERQPTKPLKIYADGVFDLAHFGHFNALRQARQLGDELYVGVISDEEVLRAKGVYPVYTCAERARIIGACRWVTGVIPETPYDVSLKFLASTGCDYVAHGDDLALNGEGVDCYAEPRQAGRLKIFKRTFGVSTTTIVSRLLGVAARLPMPSSAPSVPTPAHDFARRSVKTFVEGNIQSGDSSPASAATPPPVFCDKTMTTTTQGSDVEEPPPTTFESLKKQTLLSAKRILQFVDVPRHPELNSTVVYVDGSFDIFHCGHVSLLEQARARGDFLLVGVYDDATTRALDGPLHPLQTMLERALNVMAMKAVDDVIIGAPPDLTDYLLSAFRVSKVVRGRYAGQPCTLTEYERELKDRAILEEVTIDTTFTSQTIIDRVLNNRSRIQSSLLRRQKREDALYTSS